MDAWQHYCARTCTRTGAESFTNHEAHIWSFSSMFGGNVWDSKFLLAVIMNERIPTKALRQQAEHTLVKFFAWSMSCLTCGVAPARAFDDAEFAPGSLRGFMAGRRIAGRFWFVFGGHKADRKGRIQCHNLRRNYMCNYICELCAAVKPGPHVDCSFSYGDFRDAALWRDTLQGHRAYLATEGGRLSAWTQMPGCWALACMWAFTRPPRIRTCASWFCVVSPCIGPTFDRLGYYDGPRRHDAQRLLGARARLHR